MGAGRNGFCCGADWPGRSGQFVRIANVWLSEVMSGLICGGLICGGAFALEVLRLRGSGVAATGFRIGVTEGRSCQSQPIAAASASPSAYCTPINTDHERMLFALLSESASSENQPELVDLAIPVPLLAVLARAEECCSKADALGASLISRAHCTRQLAASAGHSVSMWAAE